MLHLYVSVCEHSLFVKSCCCRKEMKSELPEGNNTATKFADFSHGFKVQFMSSDCFKVSAHWSM